jgi:3-deoxy-D-manno-octulosonate 8-phosphate phosphatase (KDO 8-P phosphatase)
MGGGFYLAKAAKKITARITSQVTKRAKQITVFLMDVDGTITAGGVTLLSLPDGSTEEIKTFDAHDGQGLSLAHTAGIRTGVITGRGSAALQRRAQELKIEFVYEHQAQKIAAYEEILKKTGASEAMVAYLGDDLPDITIMRRVGLAVAVGDAAPEVKRVAHHVTRAIGGKGAAREVVELILKSKGIWEEMIDKARA